MPEDLIVLYDVPSAVLHDKAWSPNVWKIRFVLHYKGLPYRTQWTESPDLAPVGKKIGAPPSMMARSGNPLYLAPIIYCPRSKKHVSNSLEIAIHLEHTYPETPRLFDGVVSEGLVRAWDAHWNDVVAKPMAPLMVKRTHDQLTPRSAARFRASRERIFGVSLEDLASPEKTPALWSALRRALTRVDGYMRDAQFVAGDHVTYPDFIMAGWLLWVKRLCGPNSPEWCAVEKWNGGRWKRHMDLFEQWEYTDDTRPKPRL